MVVRVVSVCFLLCAALPIAKCWAQHGFPAELQSLVNDQIPIGNGALGSSVPGFTDDIGNWILFLDLTNGVEFNYVLCYRLGADSKSGNGETETPFTGNVFVYCQEKYDLTTLLDVPQFLLFLQNVEPNTTNDFFFKQQTIDLRFLDDRAFFDGFGQYCFQDFKGGVKCVMKFCAGIPNNMDSTAIPIICLAGCCGAGAEFRLPAVRYFDNGKGEAEFEFVNSFDYSVPNFRRVYEHYSFATEVPDLPDLKPFLAFQRFEIPLYQPGDTNLDGVIDLLDVSEFVDCLTTGDYQFQCDIDGNGVVNLLDIQPFVDLLSG